MTIFRVEKDGLGPYKTPIGSRWQEQSHNSLDRCPTPDIDFSEDVGNSKYKYGFASMDQLNSWFSPIELARLEKKGFKVVSLEADDVILGTNQLVFIDPRVPSCIGP